METTTRTPVLVALGPARGAAAARLAAHALGAANYRDLTSRWGVVAARKVPQARLALPDVVVLYVPRVAPADLLDVLARLERSGREIVVVTASEEALACAFGLGAHGVNERATRRSHADLATASGIIAALRATWPPQRLLPVR